jgi:hypothetical protein
LEISDVYKKFWRLFVRHATRLVKQLATIRFAPEGAAAHPQFFGRRAFFCGKMEADALSQPFDMLSIDSTTDRVVVMPDPMADDSMPREAAASEVEDLVFVDETPVRDNAEEEDKMPVDGESNNGDSNSSTSARSGGPARFMIRHIHGTTSASSQSLALTASFAHVIWSVGSERGGHSVLPS